MNPFYMNRMMIYDIEHLCLRIKGGNKNLGLSCHSYLDKDITDWNLPDSIQKVS